MIYITAVIVDYVWTKKDIYCSCYYSFLYYNVFLLGMSDQQFKDTNNTFSPPDFPTIMINIKDDDRSHSTLHLNEISSPWRKGNDGSIFASPFTSRRVLNSTNETEDDVFTEVVDIRTEEEVEDKKLVDWATNVFIPACKSLLDQCCEEKVINSKIQMYLRLLSNTIVFFCNEHANIASNSRSISGKLFILPLSLFPLSIFSSFSFPLSFFTQYFL